MKRSLRLRAETLTDLSPDELGVVAGGAITGPTCACPTNFGCYSLDQCPIPTLPLRDCKVGT